MFWPEHYVGSWKIFGFVGIEMSLVSSSEPAGHCERGGGSERGALHSGQHGGRMGTFTAMQCTIVNVG